MLLMSVIWAKKTRRWNVLSLQRCLIYLGISQGGRNLAAFEGHTEAVHFHEETKYKVEMNLASLLNYGQNQKNHKSIELDCWV